jgi:hypothetical protein
MTTVTRLAVYLLSLVLVFAGAAGLGRLVGPLAAPEAHSEGGTAAEMPGDRNPAPGGLQTAVDGYRLTTVTTGLTPGSAVGLAFRIVGPDGAPVTRYTPTHERDLHLIVVRRDLSGFQHLHPQLDADGTWRTPLTVAAAGQYRLFADFQPADRSTPLTLGVDLPAPGDYRPTPLPAVARTASVDGYSVEWTGDLAAGRSSTVTLRVSRDGRPVTDLQPYLGAYGHLVALREGDLAYLHVHPDGAPGDGHTAAGPEVTFHAEVPSAGSYRLYLNFQHADRVHTAEFTAVAAPRTASGQPNGDQPSAGHGTHN